MRPFILGLGLAAVLAATPPVFAADPLGLFIGRVQAMKSMKDAMGTIGGAVSRGEATDPAMFAYPVKILTMASRRVAHVFPEGSTHPESKARPEVWSDRAGFEKAAERAVTAAEALQAAVESGEGDQLAKAFDGLFSACKNCHESYRIDKK
ncbi:cytochrome c [Magnetospira thiophila]